MAERDAPGSQAATMAHGTETERRVGERDRMQMNRKERKKPGDRKSALHHLFFPMLLYQKPRKENVKSACRWRYMRPEKTVVGREENRTRQQMQ